MSNLSESNTETIKSIIRDGSIENLRHYSKIDGISMVTPAPQPVLGRWMVLILLAGRDLRITFKIHYNASNAKPFAQAIYQTDPHKIKDSQIDDFLREVCNLTAGYVKRVLGYSGAKLVMSLPVKTIGFDDIFFPLIAGSTCLYDQWQLSYGDSYVNCSSMVEMYNPDLKIQVNEDPKDSGEDGIDFF